MTPKNKIYITCGFTLAAAALAIVFAVLPLFRGISKNAEDSVAARKEILSLDSEIKNFSTLEKQYQQYKDNLAKIDQLFINAEIPIDFLRFLEELATTSGVAADISPVSSVRAEGKWSTFGLNLSVSGSYLNFARFLEKMENAPYLIRVKNMNIRSLGSAAPTGDINGVIEIIVSAK